MGPTIPSFDGTLLLTVFSGDAIVSTAAFKALDVLAAANERASFVNPDGEAGAGAGEGAPNEAAAGAGAAGAIGGIEAGCSADFIR